MKTKFDKVYVLSVPSYKIRYNFVKQQLNDLGIDFEFVWGTDLGNINTDSLGNKIQYPQLWEYKTECTGKDFSCTINHYNAVFQAYEFGYNNVLIMEDDICFIKDKNLIQQMLTEIPDDADFVTYDPRFSQPWDFDTFENKITNCNDLFMKNNPNDYEFIFGGILYGIMNRQTMKLYLDNQRNKLMMSDHVEGLFTKITTNKYIATKCICTDELNILANFNNISSPAYVNNYKFKQKLNADDFYIPNEFHACERWEIKIDN